MTWLGDQLSRIADDMPERDLATKALEVHQRRRRNVVALAAATVVVVTLLAATVGLRALPGQPRAAARPDAPPELTTVRVGVMPTVESAPVYVALANDYFKEEGLTVEPTVITGPAVGPVLLERGSLDLAQTDYLTVMAMNAARERVKVVASMYRAAPGSFAIVVDAKSKIRTAEDLKGKKVAVPNLMVLQSLMLEAVLKQAGLERKDVRRIEITYPMMLDALKSGRVDAAILAEPFVTLARESRRTRVLEDPATRQLAGLYTAGVAASDEWIGANPRTLAAFQRALANAQRLIASDPQQVRDAVSRYARPSDMRITEATAAKLSLGSYPARLDHAELRRIADLGFAYGWFERPVDLGKVIVKGG
ncbi:ABC transporter substrate-binding protein [Nonomuraea sp. FMUSA5-5]|uniref:ABC transporter substrate-binding protein n=2 Tax=Nonomuraea TaxID=83681 RepID=A0ABX1BLJ2_9ACTN|nr:ABC transporter substrate-binding protein [Nonomuraea sp. FMUSA5-5]NJP98619.1 ABC transporter substrate-binding protein [Nonomuraea sp. FMUSA5-5]